MEGSILRLILGQILIRFCARYWDDFGANFGVDFGNISGPVTSILQGTAAAVESYRGLKKYKVEKATELPPLFEVSRKL
jgi:hypothetical protein